MVCKSELENKLQAKMLYKISKILEKHGVISILTNSALLGAYHLGKPINYCWGMVLTTFYDHIKPKEDKIIEDLKKTGFKIKRHYKGLNFKIRLKKKNFHFEICGYSHDPRNKVYYRKLSNKKKVIPEYLLDWITKIKLYDYEFQAPGDVLKFLEFLYTDPSHIFKSPGKSPSKYKTKNHMVINK